MLTVANPMRILIVDDDALIGRALARGLKHLGHEVEVWQESKEMLYYCYDAAILDWTPYGPEMVEECCNARVPFVIYTGSPDEVFKELGSRYRVLIKPTPIKQIEEALRLAIEEHKQAEWERASDPYPDRIYPSAENE